MLAGKKVVWDEGWLESRLVEKKVSWEEDWLGGRLFMCNFRVTFQIIFLKWIPLTRITCLTQTGHGRGRSHLTMVRPVAVERGDFLMNLTTSRVACICTMTSPKVSAFLL